MAQLAREREYSETVIVHGGKHEGEVVCRSMNRHGLNFASGGRFHEATMGSDKGKAVKILNELFKLNYDNIVTYGLGDSENDIPMLDIVDNPMLVQNDRRQWNNVKVRNLAKIRGTGPEGWSRAIDGLFSR
jgi:mannosyl-3-phosphoglycerate synthase